MNLRLKAMAIKLPSKKPDINKRILAGRYDEAIVLIRKELRLLPQNHWNTHWLYSQLSSAYYEKKNYKKALKYSEESIKLAPIE